MTRKKSKQFQKRNTFELIAGGFINPIQYIRATKMPIETNNWEQQKVI